ncbi:MAG: hypothetical protein A2285_06655 [Elusimicrobia bacterium RIFOXYA12_FULL_57_11]|nr:MAG: hypothetical protein A2285_06655 [Elusimicrobia bacterium RIFOXYA12_FULL_57_11]
MSDNEDMVRQQVLHNPEILLELIPTGIVFLDAAGMITYANRRAEEMLGLTRGMLSGMPYNAPAFKSTRLDGTLLPEEELPFAVVRRTKQAVMNIQHSIVWPDGRRVFLSINGAPSLSGNGEFLGMIAAMENISERKLAEERLTRLTDQVPGVVYQYQVYPDGRSCFPYSSSGMKDIYEVTPEEVREDATVVFGRIHPDDLKTVSDAILESARTLKNFHNELRMVLPRQGLRWRVSDAKPQRLPDGSTLWYGIITDITERKLAEAELQANKARLASALEMAHLGHWEYDVASDLFTFNDYFYGIFRATAEQVGGYTMHSAEYARRFVHPEDMAMVREETQKAIETTDPDFNRQVEHRMLYADGTTGYLAVRFFVLKDSHGRTVKTYGVNQDITERKLAERKQAEMQFQLQQSQKMESVGRLAGGVAHDFNNLLTAIGGYAGFLMQGLPNDDPKREDVKEILIATERAAGLTKQLLAFSRKQILNPRVLDLNASVMEVAKMLKRLIGENVRLETKLAERPCQARLDSGQIDQVLINLAINARDAMPGGGTLTLQTELLIPEESFSLRHPGLPRGPLVCLTVRDSGCGITDDAREHMFEPFFTTKEKGKGTGLGLSTVFGIVKQSGGDIEVESKTDNGTIFRIYFPHIEVSVQSKSRNKNKDKNNLLHGSETVLLVEDEDGLRRLGERLLLMNGYSVIVAADGKEALEAVKRHGKPVDLLMTDIIMPGMNGRELATELARGKLAGRTLFMSGYTDDEIAQHGVLEPGISFIYKPFTIEALSLKVREVLDGPADKAKA